MKKSILITAAMLCVAAEPNYQAEAKRWWSHVEALANDSMEGRNVGTEGYRKAADYVASEFERNGLKAAGTNGYFQPMKFDVKRIVEAQSSAALLRNGKAEPLKLGDDATISLRTEAAPSVEGQMVFVGYGLVIPEAKHDDLAGLDLKGKIAVYLSGGPASIPGAWKAHYSSASERWKALQKAGVIGTVSIPNPKSMDLPWERISLDRLAPSMSLTGAAFQEVRGLGLLLTANPARAEKLFAGSGHTFAEILEAANANKPLPHFAIPTTLRVKTAIQRSQVDSKNVVAISEGTDAKLKNEFVVLSAHLDHVGVGEAINGDKIYNGAMDNASGIASVLEIAKFFKEAGPAKRSVVFLAVTGEEKGLQGSRYFALNPTVKGSSIVADLNLDMFLPLFALRSLEIQGLDESTLGNDIRTVGRQFGLEVKPDSEPDRNRFIRSDQYSFIKQGVPALAFKFGYVKGSPEEQVSKDWLKNRYHAPSDDLNQPVDKESAAKFNRVMLALIRRVADAAERPHWNSDSFFKRFVKP